MTEVSRPATDESPDTAVYPRVNLPSTTRSGLTLVLTIIRDAIEGRRCDEHAAPSEAYVQALEIAITYEIPLVRLRVPEMARTAYERDPFGYLAIIAMCQPEGKEAYAMQAIKEGYAPNMPTWARETIRKYDPNLLTYVMELQLRLYAGREAFAKALAKERKYNTRESSCVRKKCEAPLRPLVQSALDELEEAMDNVGASECLELGPTYKYLPATQCRQCQQAVERTIESVIRAYHKKSMGKSAESTRFKGAKDW